LSLTKIFKIIFGFSVFIFFIDGKAETLQTFDCKNSFPKSMDITWLENKYGRSNVSEEKLHLGEGFYEKGTVLYAKSLKDRVEIFWKKKKEEHGPRFIRVTGKSSNWFTETGISLGTKLTQIEKINKYPFRMAGFAWDNSGGVISWGKGNLAKKASKCSFRANLRPDPFPELLSLRRLYAQVQGDREFSSGHPAMQSLNPQTYRMFLIY